jgi:hypothetical protein
VQYTESDTKLDLPITGTDFARLDSRNAGEYNSLRPRPYRSLGSATATADAAGAATVAIGIPPSGYQWHIERMTVTAGGTARVYVGPAQSNNLADFTPLGTEDVSDNASPIFVPAGQQAIVVFSGAGAGTICVVTYQVLAEPIN